MPYPRFASVFTCATLIAIALVLPSSALAATAPTLDAPAAAAKFTEGGTITFSWNGSLQGDPDTLARSFFRVELIAASDMPSGAQSPWTDVENFVQTEPGDTVTEAPLGVPNAGTWKWRVCAWGVVDDIVRNEIEQLPGGCSSARSFESTAATITTQTIGEMKMETKTQVEGHVNTVYVKRPATVTHDTAPPVKTPPPAVTPLGPSVFQPIRKVLVGLGGGSGAGASSVNLGSEGLASDQAASRHGLGGSVMTGLGSNLPLIPIPFWTLALLLACIPVARRWRKSVLGMFDWSDGSIDGSGGLDHVIDDIAILPHAQLVKVRSTNADGDAPAENPRSAPDRGRRAA
jgi:hypothetical protein